MEKLISITLMALGSTICMAQVPANDDPCGAINLPANPSCTTTSSTNVNATATSGIPAPGCAAYTGQDVWYRVTVPASGGVRISTFSGTMNDSGVAFYSSLTCAGPFTLLGCDDDSGQGNMSRLTLTGLSPGSTIWVRVWEAGGGQGTFNICALDMSPCGLPNSNDYCPSPATLTQGPGTFSATTDITFGADQPGNVASVFCGTIENNSWYKFVAATTTHTFPITSVTGCINGWGIQGHVYSVTHDAQGCCTSFTSMSNCYNPGNTTLGTITATGLTIGQTYILMIDGYAGDGCEFTISGWSAIGILPVELSEFSGTPESYGNELRWTTESEYNNDYFEIQHSRDGYHFETVGVIQGAGTIHQQQHYNFVHQGVEAGINYYQLEMTSTNGGKSYSKMIAIKSENISGLFHAYPNPAHSELVMEFQSGHDQEMTIQLVNAAGAVISTESVYVHEGYSNFFRDLSELSAGVYTLIVSTDQSSQKERIIKID